MVNNNYPQITSVTSEALQAQIRNLLPSQQGFGTDLMAQNVIVPVIDLTRAAEGSTVGQNLQTALAFGSQTVFTAQNATDVIANTAGFWQIVGSSSIRNSATVNAQGVIQASDGLSVKNIWCSETSLTTGSYSFSFTFDLVVFLDSGESVSAVSNGNECVICGSARQIADINGNLVNPSGFNPQ